MKQNKAQASVEFMTMLGIALAIFFGLFIIGSFQGREVKNLDLKIQMEETCKEFATAVNIVSTSGHGFEAYIILPEKIEGKDYTLRIQNKTTIVNLDSQVVFCRLITENVDSTEVTKKGEVIIKNINETIYIE